MCVNITVGKNERAVDTQLSEAVCAGLIVAHDLHGLTDGCFHIIIIILSWQEIHQNLLHIVLFEFLTVS